MNISQYVYSSPVPPALPPVLGEATISAPPPLPPPVPPKLPPAQPPVVSQPVQPPHYFQTNDGRTYTYGNLHIDLRACTEPDPAPQNGNDVNHVNPPHPSSAPVSNIVPPFAPIKGGSIISSLVEARGKDSNFNLCHIGGTSKGKSKGKKPRPPPSPPQERRADFLNLNRPPFGEDNSLYEVVNSFGEVQGPISSGTMLSWASYLPSFLGVRKCGDRFFMRLCETKIAEKCQQKRRALACGKTGSSWIGAAALEKGLRVQPGAFLALAREKETGYSLLRREDRGDNVRTTSKLLKRLFKGELEFPSNSGSGKSFLDGLTGEEISDLAWVLDAQSTVTQESNSHSHAQNGGGKQLSVNNSPEVTKLLTRGSACESELKAYFQEHYRNMVTGRLVNPGLGYFSKKVEESGEDKMCWEERWVNPLLVNFSQQEIHPFFTGKKPVEETIKEIVSEEVCLEWGGGTPTGVCRWNPEHFTKSAEWTTQTGTIYLKSSIILRVHQSLRHCCWYNRKD